MGFLPVEPDEIAAIQRQHRAAEFCGAPKHLGIRPLPSGLPILLNRSHVVSEPTQFRHRLRREMFVGIEQRHVHASAFSRVSRSISSRCAST